MQEKRLFGKMPDGTDIYLYTLKSEKAEAAILTFGGILQRLVVFDRDVVGGFDTLADYLADDSHQGELIGRTCNRIGNATFMLEGKTYQLEKNDNDKNHLHGGNVGFGRRVWDVCNYNGQSITLSLFSPNGEEHYPGNVRVEVIYTLIDTALMIEYRGETDQKTPLSMTNHAYFNLLGYGNGDILGHSLWLDADTYTETDTDLIPTGRHLPVENTHYDFRQPAKIGEHLPKGFIGFDSNFMLNGHKRVYFEGHELVHGATLSAEGLTMEVYTDRPGIQLYIGNFLTGLPNMKGGKPKVPHTTVCLETQTEPNAVQRGETILAPGDEYYTCTVYSFEGR